MKWGLYESGGLIEEFDTYEEARERYDREQERESRYRFTHYNYYLEAIRDDEV